MAVELTPNRWCDWHLRKKDEKVEGVEYEVGFKPTTSRAQPLVMDLCDDCRDRFGGAVIELMDDLRAKGQGRRTATERDESGYVPTPGRDAVTCPSGDGVTMGKAAMATHARDVHGLELPQLAWQNGVSAEGQPVIAQCSTDHDPPFGYATMQGVTMHRMRAHNVGKGVKPEPYAKPKKR